MKDERPAPGDKGNGRGQHFEVIDRRPRYGDEPEPAPGPRLPTAVEELKARAEEAERRTREISAAYRALELEREAFRERLGRDLERRVELARADILRPVIGVLDDLDRALAAARASADPRGLAEGVALIRDRLFQALAAEGVEPIETVGHPFDPTLAEAVATEPTPDPSRDRLVVEEIEKGYTLRGALLRPARVRVARGPGGLEAPPERGAGPGAPAEGISAPPPEAGPGQDAA